MELSYNWLLNYLPENIAIDELSIILTKIGLEVEHIEKYEAIKGSLEGLVFGEVLTCIPHPNADKLKITTVDVGNGTILPIVCGAPNVAAGQKVIVATVGTTVYPTQGEPFEIKKAKIRGEVSEGMICADDEIGLGTSHDGIKVLPNDVTVGTLANEYFEIPQPDYTISIGLTPNRSDANSHIGVAKDICAYQTYHTGKLWEVKIPNESTIAPSEQLPIKVTIEDTLACPQYAGIVINNVTVGPSPDWLIQALGAIGQRSINNIVDITNYVLHELGQPLHAFDYKSIKDHHIIVKKLAADTKFLSLDEKERKLTAEDLMICDSEGPLAMGGVFGGLQSGVKDDTKTIFLESAYFDPKTIRRTSMHHGLRTDAATHFEKSVDISLVIPALQRAANLIINTAGGNIASEVINEVAATLPEKFISFKLDYIYQLCGKVYDKQAVITLLTVLGFEIIEEQDNYITVKVPSNKADVHQAADIAEEILRIDGLDNVAIPDTLKMTINDRKAPISRKWKERIANHLTGLGFMEIITNSIGNAKHYPNHQEHLVKMLNSLTTELDCMRPELMVSGLEVLSHNINRRQQDLKIYEIGNVYSTSGLGKYNQKTQLGIWLTGNVAENHWDNKSQKVDLFYAKGIVSSILKICNIHKFQISIEEGTIKWSRGKDVLAQLSNISTAQLKQFDIKQEVFYIVVHFDTLMNAIGNSQETIKYKELPKYPAMKRDLAVVVDKQIQYEQLINVIQKQKQTLLIDFDLFDVFESEKLGANKKSLALSFTYLDREKTLTDKEVDEMIAQLINGFETELKAEIRK